MSLVKLMCSKNLRYLSITALSTDKDKSFMVIFSTTILGSVTLVVLGFFSKRLTTLTLIFTCFVNKLTRDNIFYIDPPYTTHILCPINFIVSNMGAHFTENFIWFDWVGMFYSICYKSVFMQKEYWFNC